MYLITDPNEMRPDERFLEVVWIVANGFSRIGEDLINKSIDSGNPDNMNQRLVSNLSERPDNVLNAKTGLALLSSSPHC